MSSKLKTLSYDAKIWERVPWDTPGSFDKFLKYYLPQAPPRTTAKAYRDYNQIPDSTRRAPSNWHRWSGGRDKDGRRIQYEHVMEDGSTEIRPVPTWKERGAAFDKFLTTEALRKIQQEAEAILGDMRESTTLAFRLVSRILATYQPTGRETLGELALGLSRLNGELERLYGLEPLLNPEKGLLEEGQREETTITDMDRVEGVADIINRALARKRGATKPEGK